jgi:hypothetical protein
MIVTKISDRFLFIAAVLVINIVLSKNVLAQNPSSYPLEANVVQNMAFGAFTQGATGGTVTINTDGTRVATGDVILMNFGFNFNAATINISGSPGTSVSILLGTAVTIPGSNGGSMTLQIDNTDPVSPIILKGKPPASVTVYIGGTLTVGNSTTSPPGSYSGTFDITFIDE